MCDACCVDPCNRARRSTEFLHSDYREPVCARQASWYLVVQVHNAPAEKKKKKQLKKMSAEMVLSQKGFSFQSHLNYY